MANNEHPAGITPRVLWGSALVAAVALAVQVADHFVPSFGVLLEQHPDWKGTLKVLAVVLVSFSLFFGVVRLWQFNVKPALSDLRAIRRDTREAVYKSGTLVHMIKPGNIDDFRAVFGRAEIIRAYNPPLKLLTEGHPEFRAVILEALQRQADYRLLAATQLLGRIQDLYRLWNPKRKRNAKFKVLENMKILYFDQEEGLHSQVANVCPWGDDLRGLSYFLVRQRQGNDIALLYLLGEPFVKVFDVPRWAIKITAPPEKNEIYDLLAEVFDDRWSLLDRGNSHPCPLPMFCEAERPRLRLQVPERQKKAGESA